MTQLGWWDQTPASPLAASHQVGLWSVSGTLIASATVLPGDPLTGGFRYAALSSPVTLGGGTVYMIGGRDTLADGDNYSTANSALVMGAGINFGGATRSNVGVGFAFPVNTTGDPGGHFGPNFIYAAVPEASTQLMMLMGLGAVGGLAARRRARAAAGA